MIVAPAYIETDASRRLSGLTTISCGVDDLVDEHAELAVVGLEHGEREPVDARRRDSPSTLAQVDEREQLAAQAVHRRVVEHLDARPLGVVLELHELDDVDLGDREPLAGAARPAVRA